MKKHRKIIKYSAVSIIILIAVVGYIFLTGKNSSGLDTRIIKNINKNKMIVLKLERKYKQIEAIEKFSKNSLLPLDILRDLSANMPQKVYVRQLSYDYLSKELKVKGRTDSYFIVSEVADNLKKSELFLQIVTKGAHAVKIGDKELIDFEVICSLKMKDKENN